MLFQIRLISQATGLPVCLHRASYSAGGGFVGGQRVVVSGSLAAHSVTVRVYSSGWWPCIEWGMPGQASEVAVRARTADENLYLSIRDDGIGGADSRKGSGIIGLKDRIDVLGGKMTVNSPVGSGTAIDVTIPLAMPSPESHGGRYQQGDGSHETVVSCDPLNEDVAQLCQRCDWVGVHGTPGTSPSIPNGFLKLQRDASCDRAPARPKAVFRSDRFLPLRPNPLRVAPDRYQTAAVALVMSSSTWVGRVANEAWLVSSSMVSRARIRLAIHRWVCGGIIRSWAET